MSGKQHLSELLANGQVIREPDGYGKGFWIGAPGLFHDRSDGTFYLSYRIRRPRGILPDRGAETRIARSSDGVNFEDMWSAKKEDFPTTSIERSALCRGSDNQWRLFTSYVDPADHRWCVAVIEAPTIEQLDPIRLRRVFSAADLGLEGIKDPWVFEHEGLFHMIVSVALTTPQTNETSHAACDIYNTGQCLSATGLATSPDLNQWQWVGVIFTPSEGWDRYCRRINSLVFHDGRFLAFYDGSESHEDNYEEKTGLAESTNLRNFRSLTPDGPAFISPNASGSLRYVDIQVIDGQAHIFYEFTREDGSHDLRMVRQGLGVITDIAG